MAEVIQMPKMSDTMTEGVIAKWHKQVGDSVKAGELMAEIETDKATMDFESYSEGILLHLGAKEGQPVLVNSLLAIIGKKGEDITSLLTNPQPLSADPTPEIPNTSTPPPELVLMPKMSDTMSEGVIAKWHKQIGESVKQGELIAEIETDKATMDYESYQAGILLYKGAKEKETVAVNSVLAVIGDHNTDWKKLLEHYSNKGTTTLPPSPAGKEPVATPQPSTNTLAPNQNTAPSSENTEHKGRIKISPLARKLAKEKGYDLSQIQGSGDGGRIIQRDIANYQPANPPSAVTATLPISSLGQESYEEIPLSQARKTIARRLSESKFSAPHFYLSVSIQMDKAIAARASINEIANTKISFNDLVIKTTAAALKLHPHVNVSWQENYIRKYGHIHLGIAVAVEGSLVVPVIRFADQKSLSQIAHEVKEAAQKAKEKKLQPADFEGSTFTISNLGMWGVSEFTAIINPPNACILAVGAIQQAPVVNNGQLAVGHTMNVTLSCDHRVVDGAIGAAFLKTLKSFLEDPVRILA